jgi:hypothetical protein
MLKLKHLKGREESASFLKKRSKKLFPVEAQSLACGTHQIGNGFLLLFFKKEVPPSFLQANSSSPKYASRTSGC